MKKRILVCLAALSLLLACLAGCGSKNTRAVGTCAGYDVAFEELRYVALSVQDLLKEQYGEDAWKDHRAELEAEVSARIAKDYNVLAAAAQYLPDRRPDDKDLAKRVDAAVAEATDALGGKAEYKQYLKDLGMTEHLFRFHIAKAMIEEELSDVLFAGTELENKETFSAWLTKGNFVHVRQIFAQTEADAQLIRTAIVGGAEPDDAVKLAGGAYARPASYLVRGLAVDQTLEADAFALAAVGDVSQPRETDDGWRILVRTDDNAETFLANQASAYLDRCRKVRAEVILAEFERATVFELNAYGKTIDLLNIR